MIWFNAKFKVATHGGNLDTKPKKYEDLLVRALSHLLTAPLSADQQEDVLTMMRSIEVEPSKPEAQ